MLFWVKNTEKLQPKAGLITRARVLVAPDSGASRLSILHPLPEKALPLIFLRM